jgi:hypothetical protein
MLPLRKKGLQRNGQQLWKIKNARMQLGADQSVEYREDELPESTFVQHWLDDVTGCLPTAVSAKMFVGTPQYMANGPY